MAQKLLIVEDESDIRELIALHLKRNGFSIDEAVTGDEGIKKAFSQKYDALVLDWMLPGLSGIEIIKKIKNHPEAAQTPILMVTAKGEAKDIVEGLDAGADDYVTKPFDPTVLVARLRSLLRRGGGAGIKSNQPSSGTVMLGNLKIRPDFYEVKCGDDIVQLTPSEFKLLLALSQQQGRVLTRAALIELVQGAGVAVVDRAIDTHVFGLRKKLGACADVIETIRGVGYRIKTGDQT